MIICRAKTKGRWQGRNSYKEIISFPGAVRFFAKPNFPRLAALLFLIGGQGA